MLCSQTTVEYAILKKEADKSGENSPKSEILREINKDDEASTALVHLLLSEGLRADKRSHGVVYRSRAVGEFLLYSLMLVLY